MLCGDFGFGEYKTQRGGRDQFEDLNCGAKLGLFVAGTG